MSAARPVWLVTNSTSGSNSDKALQALEASFAANGLRVAHRSVFPAQNLPTPAMLDAAGIDLLAVYAGDGTINTLLGSLAGWDGQVLVLPGGTMNLIYHRLHGARTLEQAIEAAAKGKARAVRPEIAVCASGRAYGEVLAGPGTHWSRVREALREPALSDIANQAAEAIGQTLGGAPVHIAEPALGRAEGYPMITLSPRDSGLELRGYYAETPADFVAQTLALVRHSFREGPHDELGQVRRVTLASLAGEPVDLRFDGEEIEGEASVELTLEPCGVDLLATEGHG